jgi:hypothetical protein
LTELQRITPKDDKGRRKHKFHQRLTEDVGHPALAEHLSNVVFLMRAAANWDWFCRALQRSAPKFGQSEQLLLELNPRSDNGAHAN